MNIDGSRSSDEFSDDKSDASTAGPSPDSLPLTGRFNKSSWANIGEACPSGASSLTNSFSVQFRPNGTGNFRSIQRMSSSIFLHSSHHNFPQSVSASPTVCGSLGRDWGRSFIVRPASSTVGRGYRSLGGTGRNFGDLDRSTVSPQRGSTANFGWGMGMQDGGRASICFSSSAFYPMGSPLHSPAMSSFYGQLHRTRTSPAVALAQYAMGACVWSSTLSKELSTTLNSLKSYIALVGKTVILDVEHPLQVKQGGLLGFGGFAKVFVGLDTVKGELLAIKEMSTENITDVQSLNDIQQEFALLQSIRHPNVIKYYFFEHSKSQKVCRIVMELLAGNSTMHLLQQFGPLTEVILRKITRHLLQAISVVHNEGIFHRDIKPANILVSHTGEVKLCDFGCSKRVSELSTASSFIIGTPVYMAPELIKGTPHQKSDIWSVGCTLFELATGLSPWHHCGVKDNLPLMFYITTSSETPLVIPKHIGIDLSPELMSFLNLCFTRDVRKRPNAVDLLRHPWIDDKKVSSLKFSYDRQLSSSPFPVRANETKYSEMSLEESKNEEDMALEEEEHCAQVETLCQQELEDVCAQIALERCCQLMNYQDTSAMELKIGDAISDTTRTTISTPTPSFGKQQGTSILDIVGGDATPEQSILHDEFVFQQAPLGMSAGNFVLPTETPDAPLQQFLRIDEEGKLTFATLQEERMDGFDTGFRSPSVESSFIAKSMSQLGPSGRRESTRSASSFIQRLQGYSVDSPLPLHDSGHAVSQSPPLRGRDRGKTSVSGTSQSNPIHASAGGGNESPKQVPSANPRVEELTRIASSAFHSSFSGNTSFRIPEKAVASDGKIHTCFSVNAASGKEVNVPLEVDVTDLHLRMVNNSPNYIIAFNERIRNQIFSKLKEVSSQDNVASEEMSREAEA